MAITLGQQNMPTRNHVVGNRRQVVVDGLLDSSYPTGGYALTFVTLGIDGVPDYVTATSPSGHDFGYDYTNQKLKAFLSGSEVTAATNLSTVVVRITAQGKGSPTL
jgi:hypothetical protein